MMPVYEEKKDSNEMWAPLDQWYILFSEEFIM